jgi:hypothetical protein
LPSRSRDIWFIRRLVIDAAQCLPRRGLNPADNHGFGGQDSATIRREGSSTATHNSQSDDVVAMMLTASVTKAPADDLKP